MIRRACNLLTFLNRCTGCNRRDIAHLLEVSNQRGARGMVLLLGLALLAGLSLLALLAANSMLQQRQMAANHADSELARASALTAVSSGEHFLLSLPAGARSEHCSTRCFAEPTDSQVHEPGSLPPNAEFLPDDWWSDWGLSAPIGLPGAGQSGDTAMQWALAGRYPPLFLLEELKYVESTESIIDEAAPMVSGIGYYRVLGRGTGVAPNSTRVVESIFARPWPMPDTGTNASGIQCNNYRPWFDCGRMAYRERR
jgi:Tfp pilus assembly protein PilX